MNIQNNNRFMTVGALMTELKKFENDYPDSDVVCCLPDETVFFITSMRLDKEGDLCIFLEEEEYDGFYYSTDMLLFELESYGKDTKVYLDAPGLYLTFKEDNDGSLFSYDDIEDYVSCDTTIIGRYEVTPEDDESYVRSLTDKINRQKKFKCISETIVLVVLAIMIGIGLIYNVVSIVRHTCSSYVESGIWSFVCLFLLSICCLTLYYSKD